MADQSLSDIIAARCHDLRAVRGLTLQEVATQVGTTKSWIWEIENGRARNPTVDMAVKLARTFGVSLDFLTGLSTATVDLHPEAMRIACEIDAALRSATIRARSKTGGED